jgi:hypothetical protein
MTNCIYCKHLEPVLEEVKETCSITYPQVAFETIERANIPQFEKSHPKISKLLKTSEIISFPDVRIVVQKGKALTSVKYNGNRTKQDIIRWIKKNISNTKVTLGGKSRHRLHKRSQSRKRYRSTRRQSYS